MFYCIKMRPATAIRLPIVFLVTSSRSFNNIAAPIKIITTLKVVTAETTLRLPTLNMRVTHEMV